MQATKEAGSDDEPASAKQIPCLGIRSVWLLKKERRHERNNEDGEAGGGQRKSHSRRRRAMLEYIRHGKRCKVKFLDADVKRSFVSAVVDEGIVVVFGLRVSSLEKREAQRIPMHARRRVFHTTIKRANASEHNGSCES